MTLVSLYVDPRAGSADLLPHLDAEVMELPSADVLLFGRGPDDHTVSVAVEVKSVTDLLSSIATGRVQTQLARMHETYDICWLLVYGAWRQGRSGELQRYTDGGHWVRCKQGRRVLPWSYLEAWLMTAAARGTRVKQVFSMQSAADWLQVLQAWWSKPWDKHKGLKTLDTSQETSLLPGLSEDEQRMVDVASKFPCMGPERAKSATMHFDSIGHMVTAPVEEWLTVDGIGTVTARAFVESVWKSVR